MSTLEGWEWWEYSEYWRNGSVGQGGPSANEGGSGMNTLATALVRDLLVSGPPGLTFANANRRKRDVGTSLQRLAPEYRQHVLVLDLLRDLQFDGVYGERVTVTCSTLSPHEVNAPTNLEAQLADVEIYADLRSERASEIMAQMHYNPAFWAAILPLDPLRTPRTLELMEVVTAFAAYAVHRVKVMLDLPRPHELSPRIQPLIVTPGHATCPSGHATQSTLLAWVLSHLVFPGSAPAVGANPDDLPDGTPESMLFALANRIAENRVVAGVHFPVDSERGAALAAYLFQSFLLHAKATVAAAPSCGDSVAWLWQEAKKEWNPS